MSLDVLAAVRTHYPSLTRAEKDIADFVLAHGDEVVYMPITELAFRCSVGVTSIMRFCRRIGRTGYQVLRLELASAVEAERLRAGGSDAEAQTPFEAMMNGVHEKHQTAILSTRRVLTEDTLRRVVKHLIIARQVYFFGLNRSLSTALGASQFLMTCLHKGCCALEPYAQRMLAGTLSTQDTALFVSHSGCSEPLLSIAGEARDAGAYTIAITCHGESPLSRLCHVNLCCGCNANPSRPSELDMLTGKSAMAFLLEVICTACQDAFLYGRFLPGDEGEPETQKNPPVETVADTTFYLAE